MENIFIYVIYISSTPTRVWKALFDPAITKKYWQHQNVSDWRVGSGWEHRAFDKERTLRLIGKVIEFSPPRRLVLSWAFPEDEAREDRHSRVAIDIEPFGTVVRLTVTHGRLEPGSRMLRGISEGWPMVLSSLKSLLEKGRALPQLWEEDH